MRKRKHEEESTSMLSRVRAFVAGCIGYLTQADGKEDEPKVQVAPPAKRQRLAANSFNESAQPRASRKHTNTYTSTSNAHRDQGSRPYRGSQLFRTVSTRERTGHALKELDFHRNRPHNLLRELPTSLSHE